MLVSVSSYIHYKTMENVLYWDLNLSAKKPPMDCTGIVQNPICFYSLLLIDSGPIHSERLRLHLHFFRLMFGVA